MQDRNNNVRECKYVLKRLRNTGYRADLFVGNPDQEMRDEWLAEIVAKSFDENSQSDPAAVFTALKKNRPQFARALARVPEYGKADSRAWTILIDGGGASVYLTLYKNFDDINSDWFELYDGNQHVRPWRVKVNTESFEILGEKLNDLGIVCKVNTYPAVLLERMANISSTPKK